jgi:alpha-1,3-mannosyltransferase
MKVVHVVRQYTPSLGGMEEVVRSLVQHQKAHTRYQPTVVTLDRVFRTRDQQLPHAEVLDGVPVHRLAFRGSERYPLCPQVLQALQGADLVHVHAIDFFFDYLALTNWVHRKPLIASTHGGFFHSGFAPRLKQLYFRTVTRCSAHAYGRIVATSENDGALFKAVVSPQKLCVIENGVDTIKFSDASLEHLAPTLIYFGRWATNKGILEMLDVLAALVQQQPDTPWKLILAGRAYDLDEAALATQAALRGVASHVEVVAQPDNATLRRYIATASYFFCLSRHEGFGIAPIEGMSAGLTPLLSPIPPFRHLVEATGVGLVLDADSAAGRAEQICHLHQRRQMQPGGYLRSRSAARAAADRYAWSEVADRYTQQYDQILEAV